MHVFLYGKYAYRNNCGMFKNRLGSGLFHWYSGVEGIDNVSAACLQMVRQVKSKQARTGEPLEKHRPLTPARLSNSSSSSSSSSSRHPHSIHLNRSCWVSRKVVRGKGMVQSLCRLRVGKAMKQMLVSRMLVKGRVRGALVAKAVLPV